METGKTNRRRSTQGLVHGKDVKGIGGRTGSLPCLALGRRCGSHACRVGRFVGSTPVTKSVAHKVGNDVNVYPFPTVSQTITIVMDGGTSSAKN